MTVLDTFKGRFSSGNSIPVERARASIEELEAIKPVVEQLKRKVDKRLRLLKLRGLECTALPTRLEDISDQLDRLVSEDITVALSRNDGVVRETEMRPLLHLCTKLQSFTFGVSTESSSGGHFTGSRAMNQGGFKSDETLAYRTV